jgi:hypothetical protein
MILYEYHHHHHYYHCAFNNVQYEYANILYYMKFHTLSYWGGGPYTVALFLINVYTGGGGGAKNGP